MARRQVRLIGKDLTEKLPEYSGQKINIVKKSGGVIFIYFDKTDGIKIDGRNMRLRKVSLAVSEINEIIIDIPA